jgi:GNAT superfamily N-acetyltransferase
MTTVRSGLSAAMAATLDGDVRIEPSVDVEAELPGMYAVADRARRADGEIERGSFEAMRAYYGTLEHFAPATDLVIVRRATDIAGYARVHWSDANDGDRWYESACFVDPDLRRQGVGARLLAWAEARRIVMAASDVAAGLSPDRNRWLVTFNHDGDVGGDVLLRGAGYAPFRRFHAMRRPDYEGIPELPLPDGLELRPIPFEPEAIRAVIHADNEAFRDHFGSVADDESITSQIIADPDTDTSLWMVAFDGDEIAGAVLNGIHMNHDDIPVGWLDSVFTRRPWRRRGLARALISRSLVALRDWGLETAALGVDAANASDALGLYESCGFRVASSTTAFRKPFPDSDATTVLRNEEGSA